MTPAGVYDRYMATPEGEGDVGVLVGREDECASIDELLRALVEGEARSLLVRGEGGIGKSSLLSYAAERAGSVTVLRTVGVEAEADVGFAGLYGLVRPVLDRLDELPETQASALAGALGVGPSAGSDRLLVSVATLSLLAAAAEDRPVLCLIDDAQFLDGASAEALVFSARRLVAEPVAMLFAAREGTARPFAPPGVPDLVLGGLDRAAAVQLLDSSAPTATDEVREWLLAEACGNPLALTELPTGLTDEQLENRAPLPHTAPLTARLRSSFLRRIGLLPDQTRDTLLIVALEDEGSAASVLRAASEAGLPEDVLDPAENAGLLRIDGGRVEFGHPLIRSALLESTTDSERRRAHRALAAALDGDQDADRRVWHQAAAALTVDDDVAAELEASGRRYRERAAHASAASVFSRAADLAGDEEVRIRLLAEASWAAWAAGQPERAREMIARALTRATGQQRARLLYLRGVIEARTGDERGALAMLVDGVDASEDASFKLEVLTQATEAAMYAGDAAEAAKLGARASECTPRNATDRFRLAALGGVAAQLAGDYQRAVPLLLEATDLAEELVDPLALIWAARAATFRGMPRDGLPYAARAVTILRERGMLSMLPVALSHQASGLMGHGQFRLAYAAGEEGIRLARDCEHRWGVGRNLANLAMVDAVRGDEALAHAHADEAKELAASSGAVLIGEFAESALGSLELTMGRPSEATDRLLVLSDPERPNSHPLTRLWAIPDLVEAAALSERIGEITDRLDHYTDWVERSPTPTRLSLLARCRALVAESGERELFETSLKQGIELTPVEHARAELLYGEWLRRGRKRQEARSHLRRAADLFRQMGARAWEERAEGELRATGETARKRDPSTLDELTPQELQIAGLVATGLTNRQVAARLYLSPRTIDYHLRKVFSKLGITSRTELVQMGVPAPEGVPEPEPA